MPNETRVNPPRASATSESGVTESGFASVVISAPGASPQAPRTASSIRARSPGGSTVGVPPPTNTAPSGIGEHPPGQLDLRQEGVRVRHLARATAELARGVGVEVAVAAAHRAE